MRKLTFVVNKTIRWDSVPYDFALAILHTKPTISSTCGPCLEVVFVLTEEQPMGSLRAKLILAPLACQNEFDP